MSGREGGAVDEPVEGFAAALADRYVIERELGRGGMSLVYLARDLKFDRLVALKVLRPELAAAVGSQRFLQEIQTAASLQHPLILPVHDSGVAANRLYYVMPYVEGLSLRDRLDRERQLPVEHALQIARDVADGLGYAHAHGVVHRDIKPENILLAGGHALIADFGIARTLAAVDQDRFTDSGFVVGTPLYMSPEQASGDITVDARSDIYALGCVLYEMLSGEPPFTGSSGQAILARKLDEPPRSLRVVRPTIQPHLESAITRALAPVAADRFSDAAQFAAALATTGERRRRHPLRRVGPAALLVTLVVAIASVMLWRALGRPPAARALAPDPNHIAVLYFEDRSPDGSLRHVANGVTEDLIDALSRVAALRVVSPSGVRPYRDHQIPLDSVVRILKVGTLVEGNVARLGRNQLRISVRLVDPVSGTQLDERTLERSSGDLFALEGAIAEEVSRFLRERLGREVLLSKRRAGTKSVAAWELVRRADEAQHEAELLLSQGDRKAAVGRAQLADSLLADAESRDRLWTEPIVARGWLSVFLSDLNAVSDPRLERQQLDAGMAFGNRALNVMRSDPRALELRGFVQFRQWRARQADPNASLLLNGAERDLRAAVTLDPGRARAWNALSLVYQQRGDFPEASVALNNALQADAYLQEAAPSIQLLFFASLEQGDSTAASRWCETGLATFPDHPFIKQCRLLLLGWTGNDQRAVQAAWRLLRGIEERDSTNELAAAWAARRWMVAAVLARAGLAESAHAVLRLTRLTAPDTSVLQHAGLYEAYVFTLLGEDDRAVAALDSFTRTNGPESRTYVARTRWFLPLHDNPQFQALLGEDHPRRPPP